MKKFLLVFGIVFLAIGALLSQRHFISSIYGNIDPADAAKKVWAINGKDTIGVIPESGKFSIAVTAGVWKLYIEAMKPYKDGVVDNIHVKEGKSTDAGLIKAGIGIKHVGIYMLYTNGIYKQGTCLYRFGPQELVGIVLHKQRCREYRI